MNSSVWKCDEKTHRKWTWAVVEETAHLKIVRIRVFKKIKYLLKAFILSNEISLLRQISWSNRLNDDFYVFNNKRAYQVLMELM